MTLHLIINQRIKMWPKIFRVWCSKRYEDVKLSLLSVLEIKDIVKNQLKCESVALKELYLSVKHCFKQHFWSFYLKYFRQNLCSLHLKDLKYPEILICTCTHTLPHTPPNSCDFWWDGSLVNKEVKIESSTGKIQGKSQETWKRKRLSFLCHCT